MCPCCETSVFLGNPARDLDAAVADTKRCSFSLCQLIETNPVLTPSWGISANLWLMTDCAGAVDREEWRWGLGWGWRFRLSNILFLKSDHLTPPSPYPTFISLPPPPHDWEDICIKSPIWLYAVHIRLRSRSLCSACSTLGGGGGLQGHDKEHGWQYRCWRAALEAQALPPAASTQSNMISDSWTIRLKNSSWGKQEEMEIQEKRRWGRWGREARQEKPSESNQEP